MIEVSDVKTLFSISLSNEEITPHLNRAKRDFEDIEFKDSEDELEAIGCKTIYYLSPLIWIAQSAKAREFDESIETFSDIEKFQSYWLIRSDEIIGKYSNKTGSIKWGAV